MDFLQSMNIGQNLSTVGDQLVKQTSKNIEIRVGSYSLLVKQWLAEGEQTSNFNVSRPTKI